MIFRRKISCHGIVFSLKKAGSHLPGPSNMAAQAGPRPSVSFGRKNLLLLTALARCHSVCRWLVPSSTPSAHRSRRLSSFPAYCRVTTGGVRVIPNQAQVPTLHPCVPRPFVTATIMSSMARKRGQLWRNMPTGASSSCARTLTPRRKKASAFC